MCGVNPLVSDDIVGQSTAPMMGLQPPRGVTWEEVAHSFFCLQLPANKRQNKNVCDVCYTSLCLITLQPFLSC